MAGRDPVKLPETFVDRVGVAWLPDTQGAVAPGHPQRASPGRNPVRVLFPILVGRLAEGVVAAARGWAFIAPSAGLHEEAQTLRGADP